MKNYPKVLIIGQNFNNYTGGGITLTNLFYNFPKENLAVITKVNVASNVDKCSRIYQLDKKDHKFYFNNNSEILSGKIKHKTKFEFLFDHIINKISNSLLKRNYSHLILSNQLYKWIEKFNPDLIYTQLGGIPIIELFEQIRKYYKIPYVIHFMDDWIYKFPQLYPSRFHNKILYNQVQNASDLMGISDEMCIEYQKRYKRSFKKFHNPVDIEFWLNIQKAKDSIKNKEFILLFAGKLGRKSPAIYEICKAVETIRNEYNLSISCNIYSNNHLSSEADKLSKLKGTKIWGFLSQEELFQKMIQADLLLLPLSFEPDYVKITKLSMPTKTTEYMISGTPILVYAHPKTALNRNAKKFKWAYVVSMRNEKSIIQAIIDLYYNNDIRDEIVNNAKSYAVNNHSLKLVSSKFQECLYEASKGVG